MKRIICELSLTCKEHRLSPDDPFFIKGLTLPAACVIQNHGIIMIKKTLLHILSFPFLSRFYGRLTRIRRPRFLVRFVINRFASHYQVNMDHYLGSKEDYRSLSDFFVRPLDPETRPLTPDPAFILSPCDGTVADLQLISQDQAVQAKGKTYRISELIGRDLEWSKEWWLCTLYLSPADYHRFHYPWSGQLLEVFQLGNRLYPVNRHGVGSISNLFIRNERLVLSFEKAGEPCFAVAVGATFVGSVALCALNNRTLPRGVVVVDKAVRQTEEMGRFNLGSTIILLLPGASVSPLSTTGEAITTGQPLFKNNR